MRPAIRQSFLGFTERFEGRVSTMYADSLGLISVGVGNLIDPMRAALVLPFVHADGTRATQAEIATEWLAIKSRPELARLGWVAAAKLCKLHLTPASIDDLVWAKFAEMESHLTQRFPSLAEWPADAQLAIISQAWAAGPGFRAPRFDIAARAQDFLGCARECGLHTARDAVNELLYTNAAAALAAGADLDVLRWPARASFPPAASEPGTAT